MGRESLLGVWWVWGWGVTLKGFHLVLLHLPMLLSRAQLQSSASELQTEPTHVYCCLTVYSLGRATLEPQCLLLHDKVMAVS